MIRGTISSSPPGTDPSNCVAKFQIDKVSDTQGAHGQYLDGDGHLHCYGGLAAPGARDQCLQLVG